MAKLTDMLNISRKARIALASAVIYGISLISPAQSAPKPEPRKRIEMVMDYYKNTPEVTIPSVKINDQGDIVVRPFTYSYEIKDKRKFRKATDLFLSSLLDIEMAELHTGGGKTEGVLDIDYFIVKDRNKNKAIDVGETAYVALSIDDNDSIMINEAFKIDAALLAYIHPAYVFEKEWLEKTNLVFSRAFWRSNLDLYREILIDRMDLIPNFLFKEQDVFFNKKLEMKLNPDGSMMFTKKPSGKIPEEHNYYELRNLFNVLTASRNLDLLYSAIKDYLHSIGVEKNVYLGPLNHKNGFGIDTDNCRYDPTNICSIAYYLNKYDKNYGNIKWMNESPLGAVITSSGKDYHYDFIGEILWLEGESVKVDKRIIGTVDVEMLMILLRSYLDNGTITPRPATNYFKEEVLASRNGKRGKFLSINEKKHSGAVSGFYPSSDIFFYDGDKVFAKVMGPFKKNAYISGKKGIHHLKARVVNSFGVSSPLYDAVLALGVPVEEAAAYLQQLKDKDERLAKVFEYYLNGGLMPVIMREDKNILLDAKVNLNFPPEDLIAALFGTRGGKIYLLDENKDGVVNLNDSVVPCSESGPCNGIQQIDLAILAYISPGEVFAKSAIKQTPLVKNKEFWRRYPDIYREILKEDYSLIPNFIIQEQDALFSQRLAVSLDNQDNLVFIKKPSGKIPEEHNYYHLRYLFNILMKGSRYDKILGIVQDYLYNSIGVKQNVYTGFLDHKRGYGIDIYPCDDYHSNICSIAYMIKKGNKSSYNRIEWMTVNPFGAIYQLYQLSGGDEEQKITYNIVGEIQWLEGKSVKISSSDIVKYNNPDNLMDFVEEYMKSGAITPRPKSKFLKNRQMYAEYDHEENWRPYLRIQDMIVDGSKNNDRYYSYDILFYEKDKVFGVLEGSFKQQTYIPNEWGMHHLKARAVSSYGVSSPFYDCKVKVKNTLWR